MSPDQRIEWTVLEGDTLPTFKGGSWRRSGFRDVAHLGIFCEISLSHAPRLQFRRPLP